MRYYSVIQRSVLYLFLLTFTLKGQNTTLRGEASRWYAGKVIELWRFTDYVTLNRILEQSDTVAADGSFELQMHARSTVPVLLRVENVTGQMYVQPDYVYAIRVPEPDQSQSVNKEVDLPVTLGVIGADSTELNALVFDFQKIYTDIFLPSDDRYLTRASLFMRTDSLYKVAAERYKEIDKPYFRSYVTYFIASLNASLSRGETFLVKNFIAGKPIQYDHYEYMRFFNACFTGYFKSVSSRYPGQTIFNIINSKADYKALTAFLKKEKLMASDSLRELVSLVNLWEGYFNSEFIPEAVQSVVSQLVSQTSIEAHREIGRNMLAHMGRLQPGSAAPDFSARTKEGRVGSLAMFKNRWVYLNFFSTGNSSSLREMTKIADLQRRYGHKIAFLSICLDDSLAAYQKFIRQNPGFNWTIWYNNDPAFSKTAKEHYDIVGSEGYFLISNLGEIVQNPAIKPSEGIEYKFNTIFKIRQRTTRSGLK